MRKFFALIGIIALVAAAPAADAPKSLDARTAQARYDKAARDAEQVYKNTMISACQTLISDLTAARDKVLKNGAAGLDEANRINASIEVAKADLRRLQGIAQTFTIRADQDWQPTVEVKKGQRIEVKAEGTWVANRNYPSRYTWGPDGNANGVYGLQCRIGDGSSFIAGSAAIFIADRDGEICFRMNDGVHSDNDGSLEVTVLLR